MVRPIIAGVSRKGGLPNAVLRSLNVGCLCLCRGVGAQRQQASPGAAICQSRPITLSEARGIIVMPLSVADRPAVTDAELHGQARQRKRIGFPAAVEAVEGGCRAARGMAD